jgi:Ca-activated chloride channel family protein
MNKGNRYYKNELYSEALNYFLKGKEKNEKSFVPYFNCGTASYKVEDYTGAIEYFTEALKHTSNDDEMANIHYNLGNSYFKLGDFDKAIEQYKQGLERSPYNLNIKYNLELALKKKTEQLKQYPLSSDLKENEVKNENAREKTEQPESTNLSKGLEVEPSGERKFSRREAEQLINSIYNEKSDTMRDMIKKRLGTTQYEKDW